MKSITASHTSAFHQTTLPVKRILGCICLCACFFLSCHNNPGLPPHQEIVARPEQMNERVPDIIKNIVDHLGDNGGKIDSILVLQPDVLPFLYDKSNEAKWSKEERWLPVADSVIHFIGNARLYGLFP
ncbi:MAG TPA: hypothetical protein VFP87_13335, partial [Chitinophagaceae bacterium]|nr:hypothetical protein [Chitinophagaceae bacterium]